MKKIRGLIFTEWFRFFFLATLVLVALLTIANIISGLLRGNVSGSEVIFNHLITLPSSANRILPVSCLVASLFSINKLKNRNELTAIFAAGFTRKSFFINILEASTIIGIALFLILGFLDPFARKHRHFLIDDVGSKFRNLKSQGLFSSTLDSGKIWYRTNEYFFSFSSYEEKKKEILNVEVFFFRENKLNQIIYSDKAKHKVANYWTFQNGRILSLLEEESFQSSKDFEEMDFGLNESPADFAQIKSDITTLNILGLHNYIENLKESGINTDEYSIMYLEKISGPIICIIFALIASLGAFNPNRRNSSFGKNIGLVFVFTMLFWLINSYFIEQGKSGNISPSIATFTIPVVFVFILIIYFIKNRKLA